MLSTAVQSLIVAGQTWDTEPSHGHRFWGWTAICCHPHGSSGPADSTAYRNRTQKYSTSQLSDCTIKLIKSKANVNERYTFDVYTWPICLISCFYRLCCVQVDIFKVVLEKRSGGLTSGLVRLSKDYKMQEDGHVIQWTWPLMTIPAFAVPLIITLLASRSLLAVSLTQCYCLSFY